MFRTRQKKTQDYFYITTIIVITIRKPCFLWVGVPQQWTTEQPRLRHLTRLNCNCKFFRTNQIHAPSHKVGGQHPETDRHSRSSAFSHHRSSRAGRSEVSQIPQIDTCEET